MTLLDGKVVAITGAGGGIGRSHALAFAREGAQVVVNDVGQHDGETMADQVVAEITAAGGSAVAHHEDISEQAGAASLIQMAIDQYGKLDILVNNAGILRDKTLRKMTLEMWDIVVKVHLRGTFLCTKAAAQHMCERNEGGRIINTSSVSGLMGNFGQANYAAAKAGIYGFTRTAALELRKYNITVNALAPVALTAMTEDLPMMQAMNNASEVLSPDHIAPGAIFLASELAADITGQVLAVEGKRMYLYRMTQTPAVVPAEGDAWTPQQIREQWAQIAATAKDSP